MCTQINHNHHKWKTTVATRESVSVEWHGHGMLNKTNTLVVTFYLQVCVPENLTGGNWFVAIVSRYENASKFAVPYV